jgi:hypothetical protein
VKRNICVIGRGTPKNGLANYLKREKILFDQLANAFPGIYFLDVSQTFSSKILSNNELSKDAHDLLKKYHLVCSKDLREIKDFLKTFRPVVICAFSEEWMDWYIHFYIRLLKLPMVYIHTLSEISNFQIRGQKSVVTKVVGGIQKTWNRVVPHLFCAKVDTLFTSHRPNAELIRKSRRYNEVVLTNSRFYDVYLNNKQDVTEDYIVFLDSMVATHPDQIRFGFKPIDRKMYFQALQGILSKISQRLRKEVVICLHPKYDETNLKRDFGDLKTVKFRTDEYIAKADVVLFHETSSINSVALYNKKLLQLVGKQFNDFVKMNAESIRKEFPCETIDMFDFTDEILERTLNGLHVDSIRRQQFLNNFITASGEQNVTSGAQIVRRLKEKYAL